MRLEAKVSGDRVVSRYGNVLRVIGVKDSGKLIYLCETCCKKDLELWGVKREACARSLYNGCPSTCDCGKHIIRSVEQLLLLVERNSKGKDLTIELKESNQKALDSIILVVDSTGLYEYKKIKEELRSPSSGLHNKNILDSASNSNKIVCLERGNVKYTCSNCKDMQKTLGRYHFTQTRSQFVKCKDSCFCGKKRRTEEEYLTLCKIEIERLDGKFLRIGTYKGKGTKVKWRTAKGDVKYTELKALKSLSNTGRSVMHFPEGFRVYKGKESTEDYLYLIKIVSGDVEWYKIGRTFKIKERFKQHERDFNGIIVHYEVYKASHWVVAKMEETFIRRFTYHRKKEKKVKRSKKREIFTEDMWKGISKICKIDNRLTDITKEIEL